MPEPEPSLDDRMLVLAPTGRDAPLTCGLLAKVGLRAEACATIEELCEKLEQGAAALLIAEEVLIRSAFRVLTQAIARQPAWSDIPILLFTGEGATIQARRPTAQLLAPLGNVTLLDRPLRPITVVSAAQSALRGRRRQYEARQELTDQAWAVRARDQFLAMLGHELRNPLSAILMAIEVMERGGEPARNRGVIRRQTQHLTRLVDDLLDVARVTSGKIALQCTTVELNDLIVRTIAASEDASRKQGVRVTFSAAPDGASVNGDPVRLEQIVGNLLTNAIKYTPAGGQVDIAVRLDGDDVVVTFRDTGVGIDVDMLDQIFELFVQAEGSLERAKGGMGIGLTLVKRLVELHGGTVDAVSPGAGQGSVFAIRFPVAEHLAPHRGSHHQLAPVGPGQRVLIVEDNPDGREALRQLLTQCGHQVEAVGDGLEGVKRALATRPDVVLLDIGLPGLDGYQVARHIRQALGQGILLVALTGYGQPDDRRRAMEAGFDLHFTKPVETSQIEEVLQHHAAHAAVGTG